MARWYIGGLLAPRPVAAGVHQPDDELLPPPGAGLRGSGQPGLLSQRNRSACIRIPITGSNAKAKRIEFRVPDPSSNPYLAFAAMLMAGLDGIKNKIEPLAPVDKDLYELPAGRGTPTSRRCRLAGRRCSTRSRPTTSSCTEGGVFTDRPHRDVDRLQAQQRDRPDPSASAPARVRACTTTSDPWGRETSRRRRDGGWPADEPEGLLQRQPPLLCRPAAPDSSYLYGHPRRHR